VLARHYCETDWLSAFVVSFVAAIMCTLIIFFVYLFLLLVI
jgi:hypothetical protein